MLCGCCLVMGISQGRVVSIFCKPCNSGRNLPISAIFKPIMCPFQRSTLWSKIFHHTRQGGRFLVQSPNGDSFPGCACVLCKINYCLPLKCLHCGCQTNDVKVSVLSLLLERQKRLDLYLIPLLVASFITSLGILPALKKVT